MDGTISIALGDVDGDGDLDVVAGNNLQPNRLYLNNGTSSPFSGVTGIDITTDSHNTTSIFLGDVDGDGNLDVVAGNWGQPNRLYLNNGTASPFSGVTGSDITTDAYSIESISLGDVDGDGDLDVVLVNSNQANRLYLNNGTTNPFNGVTGSNITTDAHKTRSIAFGDVDGDGDLDVVAGNYNQANRLYLNDGTSTPFSSITTGMVIGNDMDSTWEIRLGDFDNDGSLDVAAGNIGINRMYRRNLFNTSQGIVTSLEVDNRTGAVIIPNAKLTATQTLLPNTWVDYYLSNDGGSKFYKVKSGVEFEFPNQNNNDLRWRAELHSLSPIYSPAIEGITITATNIAPNIKKPAPDTQTTAATEDSKYEYKITTSDVDDSGKALTLSIIDGPDWLTFTDNGDGTGTLTGTPGNSDVGTHKVKLRVTDDDGAFDEQSFDITVANVNDAPAFTSTPSERIYEGETYSYNITVTDVDEFSSVPTLTAPTLPSPSWLILTDNKNGTGTLKGTPTSADVGRHNVTLRATDKEGASNQQSFSIEVIGSAYTTLSLELSSLTFLQRDTIDASGKITRRPDTGDALSGLNIIITITAPDGTSTTVTTSTYNSTGHYKLERISGFTQKGRYTVQASFERDSSLAGSSSDALSVLVGSSAGYAIIVEGKVSSKEGLDSHNKTTNRIYKTLKARGFEDENIYFFNYDTSQTGVNASPTKANIKYAINTWPLVRMNGSSAPLYIILHDHGNVDTFYLDDETITPSDLDSWLDTLESGLSSNALLEKRIIIYGACYSGSFISKLSKASTVKDGGRVIITSAAEDEESYKGPLEPDGVRSGSYFLEELFGELGRGYTIKESFESATRKTETFTRRGGRSANTNNAYFDSSMQHPLLDDDGDRVGSNTLHDGAGDGQTAKDIYLGIGETSDTNSTNNPAEIIDVTDTVHLDSFTTTTMWAKANVNNNEVSAAWMEIRTPSRTLSRTGGSNQLEIPLTKILMTAIGASNWEKTVGSFTESGMYEVFYFARDVKTQEISPTMRSVVYKNKTGNKSPGAFSLKSPVNGNKEQTMLIFEWEGSTDPDRDNVTYNLLIATDDRFQLDDIVYREEEITTTATIVDNDIVLENGKVGLTNGTTYYWKVQAVDAYGLVTDSRQTWSFNTDNTNFAGGFIEGRIYDDTNFKPIVGAQISTDLVGKSKSIVDGHYFLLVSEGKHKVTGKHNKYKNTSVSGINVSSGKTTKLDIAMRGTDPAPDIKANNSDGPVTIGTNGTLSVKISLSARTGDGKNCDWWLVVKTPTGEFQYYDLTQRAFTSNPLATYKGALFDLGTTEILNTSGLSAGTYTYYFGIDLNMDGNLDTGGGLFFPDSVEVTVKTVPSPQIYANGAGGSVTISTGEPLSIAVSLNSGDYSGTDADWWVVVNTPSGLQYYDFTQGAFTSIRSAIYQGKLFDLGSYEIPNTSGLGAGTYTFYFGVDMNMNGILNTGGGQLYYDSVVVNITP